ncbi:acetate/propionate family kinase [Streptobacillus moniliformis]|uniref:Acetate kinase n=1 Tax=Streptobacillus moniliformis (strain ATCC 14647 / DSM 12112 / NCTC 10651 / 9901) TaxID=519441 RepID=D1AW98_STRM9|nr:acetate kinase [Streptobacillus moniliformis]ACZ00574.1 acetate kinase [Streptobacillus moniliformis DSM 12112]AVL43014.1 acetate kinase [Streptobacillus moniliformis]QXW65339.1 acetate kinase [Streptobacillus moniliformis]SQA14307.1 Acetate kinase [Streptobacillus moniliformis]
MKVLVINSGSSSLKFELINTDDNKTLIKGICERIGISNPIFTLKNLITDVKVEERSEEMPDHKAAIDLVLKELVGENGVLKTIDEVDAIGHRVVHGGEYFNDSVLVDEEVIKKLEDISELAPLHNPANVMGIKVMRELLPGKPNVAVFDTAFHQSMEKHVYTYPLPLEDYEELKVRKYGFHGTSHKYVSGVVAEMLGNKEAKIIVCHLGNGASISAVKNGKVVDTSMGLTPLAGIMMGTRCGDIDPAAVLYIMEKRGLTPKEIDTRMNKKSGFLGIFGESSDFRDIQKGVQSGNERAKLAYDMFCYRIRSYIGSYAVAMGGVDAIAFTGGIGENAGYAREGICKGLEFLGIELDYDKNMERISGNVEYSKDSSKVKIFKIETAEELMIAKDTYRLAK